MKKLILFVVMVLLATSLAWGGLATWNHGDTTFEEDTETGIIDTFVWSKDNGVNPLSLVSVHLEDSCRPVIFDKGAIVYVNNSDITKPPTANYKLSILKFEVKWRWAVKPSWWAKTNFNGFTFGFAEYYAFEQRRDIGEKGAIYWSLPIPILREVKNAFFGGGFNYKRLVFTTAGIVAGRLMEEK